MSNEYGCYVSFLYNSCLTFMTNTQHPKELYIILQNEHYHILQKSLFIRHDLTEKIDLFFIEWIYTYFNLLRRRLLSMEILLARHGKTYHTEIRIRHTAHKNLLNSTSLIIEVGGNRGHDTVKFIELYNPFIISYEPLVPMWKSLTEQFKSNPKVQIYPYGLGNRARTLLIEPHDFGNAGTSIFRKISSTNSSTIQKIELLNIVSIIRDIQRTRTKTGIIDMISINCEGCEFEVIPALILNNMTQYFRIIQFATHSGLLSGSSCIYCQIQQALEITHTTLYHYNMLWEGWLFKAKKNN
ncbi:unnamed protein product [Rotaria socialis]